MPKGPVPAPREGVAKPVEVTFEQDLARRTLHKLAPIMESYDDVAGLRDDKYLEAQGILNEAFKEANSDVSLFGCDVLDLAGNFRLRGTASDGVSVIIPIDKQEVPPIGTVITWEGITYYIAEHKNAAS